MAALIKKLTLAFTSALLLVPLAQGAIETPANKQNLTNFERDIRHELVMLPWLGVFDNLEFRTEGDVVILTGHVTRPTLRKDAEQVVRRVEGVARVVNEIEVLPLSPMDDRIRRAAYGSIYGYAALSRYEQGVVAPIRIVVKNGHMRLYGVVANETDRNLVNIRANAVAGVFSVSNHLRVEPRS